MPDNTTDAEFWAQTRADEEAARGRHADPTACGTCKQRVTDGKQVEHDECAERALLLKAADQPSWEVLIEMTDDEKPALPARFHVPVFDGDGVPNAWLCAVCWGDGWVSSWPCHTAVKHGNQVFTPDHEAKQQQALTVKALEKAQAEVARLTAQVESVRAFATSHEYRWLHELLDGYGTHGGAL